MDYKKLDGETFSFEPERHVLKLPFPVVAPLSVVEIFDRDSGESIGFLESPKGLEQEIETVRATTRIKKIFSLTSTYGITRWRVKTDTAETTFEVPDRDLIRSFPGGRVFLRDAEGNRYEVERLEDLDPESRERMEREL